MMRPMIASIALCGLMAGTATAETYEVKMLNKGEAGTMVFEPGFLHIQPGDTVTFVPTDKGHDAESIDKMIPEGATPFKGKINQEISVTLDQTGLYAVRCTPHYAMGMVMTIAVGDGVTVPDAFLKNRIPPKAKTRMTEQIKAL